MPQLKLIESGLSLEQVTENFAKWRSTRKKKGVTPKDLKEQAFSLVGRYPLTNICSALSFCYSNFRQECIEKGLIDLETKKPQFIEIKPEHSVESIERSEHICIQLERSNGAKMQIHAPHPASACQLIDHFLRG